MKKIITRQVNNKDERKIEQDKQEELFEDILTKNKGKRKDEGKGREEKKNKKKKKKKKKRKKKIGRKEQSKRRIVKKGL